MHCPDCQTLLRASAGRPWEACPGCAGEWFEMPALAALLRSGEPPPGASLGAPAAPHPPAASPRRCPVCRAVLRGRLWGGSLPPQEVALCPLGHGAWLPAGGRARLQEAAEGARRLLRERAGYFAFLALSAARGFERATRPGRAGPGKRRTPLSRLLS